MLRLPILRRVRATFQEADLLCKVTFCRSDSASPEVQPRKPGISARGAGLYHSADWSSEWSMCTGKINSYALVCDRDGWVFKIVCFEVQLHGILVGHLAIIPVIWGLFHSEDSVEIPNQCGNQFHCA